QIGCPVIRADRAIPITAARMIATKITCLIERLSYPDRLFSRALATTIVRHSVVEPLVAWTLRCPAAHDVTDGEERAGDHDNDKPRDTTGLRYRGLGRRHGREITARDVV